MMGVNEHDLTIRPLGPPTQNSDGTFSIRGMVVADEWNFYRFESREGIDQATEQWLTERVRSDGLVVLHTSEMTDAIRPHLTPSETPVMTFVFDLVRGTMRVAP